MRQFFSFSFRRPTSPWVTAAFPVLALIVLTSVRLFASTEPVQQFQPSTGALDTTFGAALQDGDARSLTSEILPDGRILVGGTFELANGSDKAFLAMLNSDGSLDTTFNLGLSGPNGAVYEIVSLADGRFLIGGAFTTYNGTVKAGIARIHANGLVDASFNVGGGGTIGAVQGITLQPDGKIIISSSFTAYNGTPRFGVARLFADGTLDATFTSPFAAAAFVETTAILADGKILIGGAFVLSGRRDVMRLNSDGTPDTTFNNGGAGTDGTGVFALRVQPDGKIVIGGGMNSYNGVARSKGARLNADGSLDLGFVPPLSIGTGTEWIEVLPDGKILVAGGFSDGFDIFAISRLNADGSEDSTFSAIVSDSIGYHIALQTDGKIVLTGWFNSLNGAPKRTIARLHSNGSPDNSFNAVLNAFGAVHDIAVQPDGKVIAAGNFRLANGTPRARLARFNADGMLDPTFDPVASTYPDPTNAANFINTIALQPDGKLMIGGGFGGYRGFQRRGIARLQSDGSLDTTFNAFLDDTSFVPGVSLQHILVLPDGKLMVGGSLVFSTGETRIAARLNNDGQPDPLFFNGTGNGSVQRIVRQPDGKLILVGSFTNFGGNARNRIIRVNADSSLDPTFSIGTGANSTIFNAELQPDGKVLIGGAFTLYNAVGRNRIARLNNNGTLDETFIVGSGASSNVLSFAVQGDGKIIIGGFFGSYNGTSANRLARLLTNGTIDFTFNSGFDFDSRFFVRRMLLQPSGRLLIGGTFRAYGGSPRHSLARLLTAPAPTIVSPFDFDGDGKTDIGIFRPGVAEWWINRSSNGSTFAAQFGATTDKIAPADYTGDGKADITVWRPGTGEWFVLRSEDSSFFSFPFGANGDIVSPADFDDDGKTDAAVYRPSNSTWYIRRSSDNGTTIETFGTNGDVPVAADYDGDGRADIAIYRPSLGQWWIKRSAMGVIAFTFGNSGDKPVQGDYTGDGKADVALWRPSTGEWFFLRSEDFSFYSVPFGLSTDIPSPGDYDGDGKFDTAVFRPSSSTWYVNRSTSGSLIQQFGSPGDLPVPNAYVP